MSGGQQNGLHEADEKAGHEEAGAVVTGGDRPSHPETGKTLILPDGEGEATALTGLRPRARVAAGAAAALALLFLLPGLQKLLVQLFLALLLTAAALPLTRWYERRLPRTAACLCAVSSILLGIAGCIALLVPSLLHQLRLAGEQIPLIIAWGQNALARLEQQEWFQHLLSQSARQAPGALLSKAGTWLTGALPGVISSVGAAADGLSRAFLSPVLAYYFLKDRELFSYRLSLWIPLRYRGRALRAAREMRREAGGYIRGQMLVALAVAFLTAIGLMAVGVNAFMLLGLVMGVCELIPYIGPFIGGIPVVLFTLPLGLSKTLWALGVVIAVQQAEGMFIAPRLMSGATGLHPVYILLLLTAGGLLFGLPGLLLALPLFVCLRGLTRALRLSRLE